MLKSPTFQFIRMFMSFGHPNRLKHVLLRVLMEKTSTTCSSKIHFRLHISNQDIISNGLSTMQTNTIYILAKWKMEIRRASVDSKLSNSSTTANLRMTFSKDTADIFLTGKEMIRTSGTKANLKTEIWTVRVREYSKMEEMKKVFLRWVNSLWPKIRLSHESQKIP